MKFLIVTILIATSFFGSLIGCNKDQTAIAGNTNTDKENSSQIVGDTKSNSMKIKINGKTFNASLFDNETATAFKAMLPLTLKMDELNGNEKKYDFSKDLPVKSVNPKTINSGDLMIWGRNTLVLFYKTFPTSYSYTKIGKIDDPAGLEAAVGAENVTVTFELE